MTFGEINNVLRNIAEKSSILKSKIIEIQLAEISIGASPAVGIKAIEENCIVPATQLKKQNGTMQNHKKQNSQGLMTVDDILSILNSINPNTEATIKITDENTIGIKFVFSGFDWDSGRVFLSPQAPLEQII